MQPAKSVVYWFGTVRRNSTFPSQPSSISFQSCSVCGMDCKKRFRGGWFWNWWSVDTIYTRTSGNNSLFDNFTLHLKEVTESSNEETWVTFSLISWFSLLLRSNFSRHQTPHTPICQTLRVCLILRKICRLNCVESIFINVMRVSHALLASRVCSQSKIWIGLVHGLPVNRIQTGET